MMTYVPSLKTRPDAIKAAIMASADRKTTTEEFGFITNKEGAGVVYSYDALPILASILSEGTNYCNSNAYQTFSYTPSSTGFVNFVLCWYKRNTGSGTNHGTVSENDLSNFDLLVYNSSGTLIAGSGSTTNNAEMVRFYATKGQTYTIKINRVSSQVYEKYTLAHR